MGELYPRYEKQTKNSAETTGNRYITEILLSRTQKSSASPRLKTLNDNPKLDKYFKEGETKRVLIDEFNSNNTRRLNMEETKAKIASLEYIQNELAGIPNVAK